MLTVIEPNAPYDMNLVLFKCRSEPLYVVNEQEKSLSFALRLSHDKRLEDQAVESIQSKSVVCQITSRGTVGHPILELRIVEAVSTIEEQWILKHLAQRFQWFSTELLPFYQAVEDSPSLHSLVQMQYGLPYMRYEGLYEGLIQTIVQQQVHFQFARQLVYTLAQDFGQLVQHEGMNLALLPEPEEVAELDVHDLHSRKFSRRKAEYMIDFSRKIVQQELDLADLARREEHDFAQQMLKQRGIGRWTVDCMQLFCLGKPDVFPIGDIGLQNAIKNLEGFSSRPTPQQCLQWIEPYKAWGSYVAVYLWGSLGE